MAFESSTSLPMGIVPVDTQLDRAGKMFETISPHLARHFHRMRAEGLIDLENRAGKQAGAYCTSFPDEGRAAIFCNSTGDASDISTLTHEMGHAFQAWESQEIELVELRWPTMDAAEIHSMGMEYLSLRHMEHFFTREDAAKFRIKRWAGAIRIMCYAAVVDGFQHDAYRSPGASFDERDRMWKAANDRHVAGIDWSDCADYQSLRWYRQSHIFTAPFYYIDYAIAETGAMQLALIDREDPKAALEIYLRLCKLGGTKSVLGVFKDAGLRSPFDPSLMRDLMALAARETGID